MTDDHGETWALELLGWWRYYNRLYLGGCLREPVIAVSRGSARVGAWDAAQRRLSVSADHIAAADWLLVMETLRHEMAHQYVDEILQVQDEPPHGTAFRRACAQLRVPARATIEAGVRTAEAPIAAPADRSGVLDRIAKLLSLSSSPNEHEAQVAINKARELLLRHNLDAADVEGAAAGYAVRWLGPVAGRHHHHEQVLASILSDYFFVSVIWIPTYDAPRRRRGTVLGAFGRAANLEMAEYVYEYLSGLLGVLWRGYRTRQGLRGNGERLRYFAGVLNGFHEKLGVQDAVLREQHALVWRGDPRLESFVRHHHPQVRSGSSGGMRASKAYEDGVADGRKVQLRRPLRANGGGGGGFGGYLTGG